MAKNPRALNENQMAVLEWVRSGSPPDTWDDYAHRIIARALETRGLVRIEGRGPSWTATLTQAGSEWEQPMVMKGVDVPMTASGLIDLVIASDGRVEFPHSYSLVKSLERKVVASLRAPNRPPGRQLRLEHEGPWPDRSLVVTLVPYLGDDVDSTPVSVPAKVRNYHPAVRAFIDDKDDQYVSKAHIGRAARILQALTVALLDRGLNVKAPRELTHLGDREPGYAMRNSHLVVTGDHGAWGLQIREMAGPGAEKLPPRRWDRPSRLPAWMERRGYAFISTGRLDLVAKGTQLPYDGRHFRDAKTSTVEIKLGDVLAAIELAQKEAVEAEQERELKRIKRVQLWEAAMEGARTDYFVAARLHNLYEHADRWSRIDRSRRFLEALEEMHVTAGDGRPRTHEFISNARMELDQQDPLKDFERLLRQPEAPSARDLEPFLKGWSPYGPSY